MKHTLAILFLLSALRVPSSALADLPVTTNAAFCIFGSSYNTLHFHSDYEDSALYLYYWRLNIHVNDDSRSGGSIEEANENRLERRGLAEWANGSQYWGLIIEDGNGGYDSNAVIANITNTFNAPGLLYNGSAYTNEGGWAQAHAGQINWIAVGNIPTEVSGGGDSDRVRNNAATNAGTALAYMGIDRWNALYNSGWSNDFSSGANLIAWLPASHPGAPGQLTIAINDLQHWIDTNINTCTLDWNTATVSATNHCIVTNPGRTGGTLTFTWKADRHSMAWDVPDETITNNATDGFRVIPPMTNGFFEVIQVTNLPTGNYVVNEDGSNILVVSSAQLAGGLNLFTVTNGAVWAQRKEVLGRIRDRHYTDRVSLLDGSAGDSQGDVSEDSFSQSFWDSGFRGDALISQLSARIANLNGFDDLIHAAATPTNHIFTITPAAPLFAPFHR